MTQSRYLPVFLREPWPLALAIGIVAGVLIVLGASPFAGPDRLWGDYLLRKRLEFGLAPKPDERIFLIGLETTDLVGASSTAAEYNTYAEIVDIVSDLEVKVIAFDLMMARGTKDDAQQIIQSIRKSQNVVLAEAIERREILRSFLFAPPEFYSGLINIASDPDGVHRRYSFGVAAGRCEPSLALASYLRYLDIKRGDLSCTDAGDLAWKELGPDQSSIVERRLPSKSTLLNFRSPFSEPWDRGFKYLNLRDLRARYEDWKKYKDDPRKAPKGLPERGDILLVGSVATGTGDAGPTPFGRFEPLMQIHATALDDLLQRKVLNEAAPFWNVLLVAIGLSLIAATGRWASGMAVFILASAVWIALILASSGALLVWKQSLVAAITPAGFMTIGLLLESGRRASLASFEKARTKETLGRYFSPNVLEDVLKNPDAMQPREAYLTVLLTDVRNFTTITERSGTKRMFDLLNDIFEVETRAAIDLDGSMEHFVGDQFLAYWGAPQSQPDAADRALQAAQRIIAGLDALHATLEPAVKELFGYGVAIHTGKALFGNKGSQRRLDYGILGDIVNAAARIESLTKFYGVREIVTKEVVEKATLKLPCRFLDRIRVKGKEAPLEMYEVIQNPTEAKIELARRYEEAWELYRHGTFADAVQSFEKLADADKPSRVMLDRCQEFVANPPVPWDGLFQFKEK